MEILVTVGLCVKNCEQTISETLNSIISQDFPHHLIEVIVVDNGCTDGTIPEIIRKLSSSDIKFKIFKEYGGLGAARQRVVDHANGKYIIWIDGDITVPCTFIRKQVEFMEHYPCVGQAKAKLVLFETKKRFLEDSAFLSYISENEKEKQRILVGIGGAISRTVAIKEAGGFDVNIKGAGEDIDLAIRMLTCGKRLSHSEATFCHKSKSSWAGLWNRNFWYGYGAHFIKHKHKIGNIGLSKVPLVATAIGVRKAISALKATRRKDSILLIFSFMFASIAWWIGYIKAHLDKYFPKDKNTNGLKKP